jgi:NADPH2:quinone reductase
MKAYLLKNTGKPDVLTIQEVKEPSPGENDVKVKILSIGINYAEILSRRGQYQWTPKRPYIPGMESYGEIVEIGSKVKSHKVGDLVMTGSQFGAYAEYICVPDYMAFPANPQFTATENAALLVSYMTAWVALVKLGRISSQDKVLIQAAAGGLGTAAVQIAKAMGCEVYGTASRPNKIQLLSELGVDHPINYAEQDFEQYIKANGGGVDLVLEVVGGSVYQKSLSVLNPFGRLIITGFASITFKKWNPITWWKTWKDAPKVNVMKMAEGSYGVMGTHLGYLTNNKEIALHESQALIEFLNHHKIQPMVGRSFAFENLPEAHRWIESRDNYGKTVVTLG